MKNLFLLLFFTIPLFAGCHHQENGEEAQEELQVVLYDKEKEAIAYIDYEDGATIYLYEGEAVAYIEAGEQVYRFGGQFLGWYVDGVLYDQTYCAVGARHGIVRGSINTVVTRAEKNKSVKQVKPMKQAHSLVPERSAVLKDHWSETALKEFFNGKK